MNKTLYFILKYYDKQVIQKIIDKYSIEPMEAAKRFLTSETHSLLEDADNGLCAFSECAVFDMWEAEQITGDLRNSVYIRGE